MQADIPGMDVGSEPVKTPNECCTKCIEHSRCEAWTHADGTCWLKSSANKVLNGKAGLTSGISLLTYNKNIRNQFEYNKAMQNIEKDPLQEHKEQIWPLPESIDGWKGGSRPISAKLSLEMDVKGDYISKTILEQGFQRTKARIVESASGKNAKLSVLSVRLQTMPVHDHNNSTGDDWYILELKEQNSTLFIFAGSTNGFLLGMETFSQVCYGGFCQASSFRIRDSPVYSQGPLS